MEALVEQLSRSDEGDPSSEQVSARLSDRRSDPPGIGTAALSRLPTPVPGRHLEIQGPRRLDEISSTLSSVWPVQRDLDAILSIPVSISVLHHGVVCVPYSVFREGPFPSPKDILRLPPSESHPVLIARKLLLLGTFLQGIPPCLAEKLDKMSTNYLTLMSLVVNTAGILVTSVDELVGSLEGIECLMIESMYWNNAGNLRRAWLTNRRAMTIAQMMGLHTGTISPAMFLQEDTRARIHPENMWFRIVVSDRYLSLILGLPQGSSESDFASPKTMKDCTPLERMERMETVAAGLILQRNSAEKLSMKTTNGIDELLGEAAALMPPQWWLTAPDVGTPADSDATEFEEIIRLTMQFAHHHLLVQLHLPYMMQPPSTAPGCEYNKMTAANASRAILVQFLQFRSSHSAISYCRGIDFIVFIASTTLCIAHIEGRRRDLGERSQFSALQSLQHQRQSDRGLLERTFETMETMAQREKDVVALKITSLLQPLLDIESDAAKGACYRTSATLGAHIQGFQHASDARGVQSTLTIRIPHFGTIKIESHPSQPDYVLWAPSEPRGNDEFTVRSDRVLSPSTSLKDKSEEIPATAMPQGNPELHTVSLGGSEWQAVLPSSDPVSRLSQASAECIDPYQSSLDAASAQETEFLSANFDPGSEDWPLQNVDTAFFRSLMRRSLYPGEFAQQDYTG